MKHDERTYFDEGEKHDVKGFTILKAENGKYHIAEKWLATEENRATEDKWIDYWIPEESLTDRHEEGLCEPKGKLTDEQFATVCEKVEWYTEDDKKQEATA